MRKIKMRVNHYFRRDIFIVGLSLLLVGVLVFLIPLTSTSVLTDNGFTYSGRAGWYQSGQLYLPRGYSISMKLISADRITLGFAADSNWYQFLSTNMSEPLLLRAIAGSSGTLGFTAKSDILFFIALSAGNATSLPLIELTIAATNPHGFADYTYIAVAPGIVLIALSPVYEVAKHRVDRMRIRRYK